MSVFLVNYLTNVHTPSDNDPLLTSMWNQIQKKLYRFNGASFKAILQGFVILSRAVYETTDYVEQSFWHR